MIARRALLALLLASSSSVAAAEVEASIRSTEYPLLGYTHDELVDVHGNVVAMGGKLTALEGGGFLHEGREGIYLYGAQGQRLAGPFDHLEEVAADLDVLLVGQGGHPMLDGKGGLISRNGDTVVAPTYRKLKYLGHGLFRFEYARRFGIIDRHGQQILAPTFDSIELSGNVLLIHDAGRSAVYGLNGKPIRDFGDRVRYRPLEESGYTTACKADDTGVVGDSPETTCVLLDPHGQTSFGGEFQRAEFHKALQRWVFTVTAASGTQQDHKYLLYTPEGKLLAKVDADHLSVEGERLLFSVSTYGEEGYRRREGMTDANGEWLIRPFKYKNIDMLRPAFEDAEAGRAVPAQFTVTVANADGDERVGVIDAHGREVLAPRFDSIISRFPSLGLYMVKQDGLLGVVDRNGSWRIEPHFEREANNSTLPLPWLMLVRSAPDDSGNDDVFELYNLETGEAVIHNGPYEFLSVEYDHDWEVIGLDWSDFAIVTAKRDGKYGALGIDGDVLLDFVYDNLEALSDTGRLRARQGDRTMMVSTFDIDRQRKFDMALANYLHEAPTPSPSKLWPHLGRYVPEKYMDEDQLSTGLQAGQLSTAIPPSLVIGAYGRAITHLNMVVGDQRPHFRIRSNYCADNTGFWTPVPLLNHRESCSNATPEGLVFRPLTDGKLECSTCAAYDLPTIWVRMSTGNP